MEVAPPLKVTGLVSLVASGALLVCYPPLRLFLVGVLLHRRNFIYLVGRINFYHKDYDLWFHGLIDTYLSIVRIFLQYP